jgi:YVTN family beta-propeller protein
VSQRTQGFAAPSSAATASQPLGATSVASRDARSAVIRAARPIPTPGAPAALAASGARQAWEAFTSRPFNQYVRGIVLGRTAENPQTTIVIGGKSITVGNAILARAFFDGYDGSRTGLAGLAAYIRSRDQDRLLGDPISGFTIQNLTTPASFTAGGVTQTFRGMSGDPYEVAFYGAYPRAFLKPAVGLPIETVFGESTALTANQWWPSSSEVPENYTFFYDSASKDYKASSSASYSTTIAFNQPGSAPYGLMTQLSNTDTPSCAQSASCAGPLRVGAGGLAVSPDGRTLYAVSTSTNKLWLFDTTDNSVKGSYNFIGQGPTKITVASDGYVYVTVRANEYGDEQYGHVEYLAPTGGSFKKIDLQLKNPQGITTNAAGTEIYVADFGSNQLSIIPANATRESQTTRLNLGANPYFVASKPDTGNNTLVYVSNYTSGSVDVVRSVGGVGTQLAALLGFSRPAGLALTPDGRYLYVADEASGYVSQLDTLENNKIVNTIKVGNTPREVVIRPGPDPIEYPDADPYTVVVSNSGDNTVSLINSAGIVFDTLATGGSGTNSLAITPNSDSGRNTLYAANTGGSISVLGLYTIGQTPAFFDASDSAYLVTLTTTTTAVVTFRNNGTPKPPVYTTTSTATCRAGSTASQGGCDVFNTTPTDTVIDFVNEDDTFIRVDKPNDEWGFVQGNILSNAVYPLSGSGQGSFTYKTPPPDGPGCSVSNKFYCSGYSDYGRVAGIPIKFNESGGTNTYTWSTATAVAQATSTVKGFTFNSSTTGTKGVKDVWLLAGTAGFSYKNETNVSTTNTTTVTDTASFTIPVGYEAVVLGAWEVIKWYGDWTVTDARERTIYTLPNVWYATPVDGGGLTTEGPFGCKVGSAACASLEQGIIPGFTAENPAPADYGIPPDINGGLYYDNPFRTGITPISQLDTSTGTWKS